MHILSIDQYSPEELEAIFALAEQFRRMMSDSKSKRTLASRYKGVKLCNLFYEPSTRTRLSFGFAANNLGIQVQTTENARDFSSAAKGETLEDTIKVINQYGPEIIVLRHFETGAADRAAAVSEAAIINAGDGAGEHPTQALLDAFTIKRKHGRLDNLHIVMGGDLKNGRTVRSLAKLLSRYKNNHITFVSTPSLQMQDDVLQLLDASKTAYKLTEDMSGSLTTADVVYWTRIQKERMRDSTNTEPSYVIDESAMRKMPDSAILMHPLPRVGEIDPAVDEDPRSMYFEQAGNGLYIRMALIDMILNMR